ncbi:MAG: hypothetical protein IKX22_10630 [Prevotella sp.]|nr:hypothetical protein [Prevotella sp.]
MKREYVKPETEVIIPEGDPILEDVGFSTGGEFEANNGNFEFEDEVGTTTSSFSLWDEEK